jgi:hypothetical protein
MSVAVFVGMGVDVSVSVTVDEGTMVLVEVGKAGVFCPPHDDKIIARKNNANSEITLFLVNIFSPLAWFGKATNTD